MHDIGDTVPLGLDVRDAAGQLTNAATITLSITLPDGTPVDPAPAVVNPPAVTGRYGFDFVATVAGLHRVRWTTTSPATAFADVFNVVEADWPAFVGLAETKKHLNIPPDDTSRDDELRGFILSASAVAEDIAGTLATRNLVETYSGGSRNILLRRRPVQSVTSVIIDGTTVDPGDYTGSAAGVLHRRFGHWPHGFHNVQVTYAAGRTVMPANSLDAVKELIRINWRPQEGGNYSPFDGGESDDFGVSRTAEGGLQGEIRLGFFVPNTVMQRLQPQARSPHVA